MADISKIKIEDGTYNIKDETARAQIAQLQVPHNYFANKKFILIGDSYATGATPDGNYTPWTDNFITYANISSSVVTKKTQSGAGFVALGDNKTFQTLLEEVTSSNEITDIVALGGYNDRPYNFNQIDTAINAFMLKAIEKFPNAKIHIGQIGGTTDGSKLNELTRVTSNYKLSCTRHCIHYLEGIEYSLHSYFSAFSSDGIHPNSSGQQYIASNLIQSIIGGSVTFQLPNQQITITPASGVTLTGFTNLESSVKGNITEFVVKDSAGVNFNPTKNISGRDTWIEIGTITGGYIVGYSSNYCMIPVRLVVHSTEGYFDVNGLFKIANKKLYISIGYKCNSAANNYQGFTNLSEIQISQCYATLPTEYC